MRHARTPTVEREGTRTRRAGRLLRSLRAPEDRTTDFTMVWILVVFANLFGLVMVLSASSVSSLYSTGSVWSQFRKQSIWFVIGIVFMFAMSRTPYQRLTRCVKWGLGIALGLMIAVFIPPFGVSVNGSSRWLGWNEFRIQPSEIAKLAIILYIADTLTRRVTHVRDWRVSIRPVAVVFVVFALLLMKQPNLGTTIILATIVLVMLFVGGAPLRPLALSAGLMVAGAAYFASQGYRARRLLAFADPWSDPLNTGHQTIQSQVAFANGGLFGAGIGRGRAQWGFLPEAHTDFIYAIIGEEMGLAGSLAVIALITCFALFGVRITLHAPDRFGMLLAAGITTWIVVQALMNVAACVGRMPITGVPLPFISAGGSSLVVTMAAAGILANIARQER